MLKNMKRAISIATSTLMLLNNTNVFANEVLVETEEPAVVAVEELPAVKVFIVGDSTACEYGYDDNYAVPRNGWGMQLGRFLNSKAEVVNLAMSGRSSKSFTVEENYQTLLNEMQEGDYLLIQFGHNDAKKSSEEDLANRYTNPEGDKDTEGSFKNSLYVNYVLKAQEKGVTPILLSPIVRRSYLEDGTLKDTHEGYDDCVRELAEELGVELIDLNAITTDVYNSGGEDTTSLFHAIYNSREKGADGIDNTHLNRIGAMLVASYVAKELESGEYSISPYADLSATNVEEALLITRGQFVQDLVRLIQVENQEVENFSDITGDEAYAQAVATAKALGIARGNENAVFNGEKSLTYGDAFLFVQRALKSVGVDIAQPEGAVDYDIQVSAAFDALKEVNVLSENAYVEDMNYEIESIDAMYLCVKTYAEITEALQLQAEAGQSIDEIEKVE